MSDAPVTGDSFAKRFNPLRLRRPPVDLLDYGLFLPAIWLPGAVGISLRLIGPLFIVIPLGVCLAYAVLRSTVPPRLLTTYFAFSLVVAALSEFQLFPASWQVYFRDAAIVRQLIPLLAYLAVGWAAKAYFQRRILAGNPFFGAPITVTLCVVVAPTVMYLEGFRYPGEDAAQAMIALYGALINNVLIAMFFILGGVFLTTDWRRYAGLAAILTIAYMSHFIQFKILTVVVLAMVFGAPGRLVAIAAITAIATAYAVGLQFVPEMMRSSPDSGIRLAFVRDALTSIVDTFGAGVGYGKESVRWEYHFPGMPVFTFLPDPRTMTPERMLEALSTGVENSFFESLLRSGVLGLGLFISAFVAAFPPRDLPRGMRNHAASVFITTFLGCFVNSALESPISAVGHAYLYGYLIALRSCARARRRADRVSNAGLLPSLAQSPQPDAGSAA